ncbi:hypothetical protein J6590_071669 [Homalodisca vitripennis]|nr:hypothetical protein J6590_071669 [Homalodisca vitripennis]
MLAVQRRTRTDEAIDPVTLLRRSINRGSGPLARVGILMNECADCGITTVQQTADSRPAGVNTPVPVVWELGGQIRNKFPTRSRVSVYNMYSTPSEVGLELEWGR